MSGTARSGTAVPAGPSPGLDILATAATLRDIEAALLRAEASLDQVDPLVRAAEAAENHTLNMTRGRLARADASALHGQYAQLRVRFDQLRNTFRESAPAGASVADRVVAATVRLHDVRDRAELPATVAAAAMHAVPATRSCCVITAGGSCAAGTGLRELDALVRDLLAGPAGASPLLVLSDIAADHAADRAFDHRPDLRAAAAAAGVASLVGVALTSGALVRGALVLAAGRPGAFGADDVAVARLLGMQVTLLDHVLPAAPESYRAQPAESPAVARALAHIVEHADHDLDLAAIAAAAGIGPRRLQQVFQAELGTTPLRHLRDVRMERAHHDLQAAAAGATVAAIAARHGFTHAGRFSVDYRRAFGTTPRRTLRAGASADTG